MDFYGKRIATASSDSTIKIVGVSNNTHQHLATLTGHQGPVWQVAWAHPKFGSLLASCCYDGRVIIWKEGNQNEWSQAHVFEDHKSSVNSIAWAPHELGLCLACGSSDGNISVFTARADGGWDVSRIDQAHPVGVTSVSWAPSTAPGALVGSGLLDPVQKLCSGGCDNTVKVWKLYNGTWKMDCFPALQMHTDWVRDVAWAPNLGLPKSTIASASQDGKVIIWTVAKEGDQWEGRVLHDFGTPVWRVSWSLTGNILAVADGNNNVTLWKEAVDGEWQQVVNPLPANLSSVSMPLRPRSLSSALLCLLSFMPDLDIRVPTAFDQMLRTLVPVARNTCTFESNSGTKPRIRPQLVVLKLSFDQLSFMSDLDVQIPTAFDPFADANADDSGAGSKEYVHIRIQQRNGRKSLTTVQGLKKDFSYNKILKDLKKEFCCNGTVVQDPELGQVIQLQGDQRKNVSTFLVQAGIVKKENIKIHGVKEVDVTRKMTSTENTDQHTSAKRIDDSGADLSEFVAPCKLKSQGLHVLVLEAEGRTEGKLKSVSRVDLI
ncbi:hypothetical protein V6N13_014330 [Hibiscus sabdariffa]|uniref:SUI1 domain-containing protein n=1 Tax=Hibiscus sabdariffa TaxID=183260 RepID=A0ABR2RVI5_9ROSI